MRDNEPRGWMAGVIAAGAIALCCAMPLIVAAGLAAAVSGVVLGAAGVAVATAAAIIAIAWISRRRANEKVRVEQ